MKFLLPKLCFVVLIFSSCVSEKPCTLKLDQAPELRGFKLGMSLQEVKEKYPEFPQPKQLEYGKAIAEVYPWQISEQDNLKDIEVEFVDSRIVKINVFYKENLGWKSSDEFAQKIGESMKLDGSWKKTDGDSIISDWKYMTCDRFSLRAGFRKRFNDGLRLPFVELENIYDSFEPDSRRIKAQEAVDKKQEEKKEGFQP